VKKTQILGTVHNNPPHTTQHDRIGWVSEGGIPRYVDYEGGHGASGKTKDVKSSVLPDVVIPASYSLKEIRQSVKDTIEAARIVTPDVWVPALAAMYYPLSGMHPEASLFFYGTMNSGKSTIMGWLQSAISPTLGPTEPMYKIKQSAPTVRTEFEKIHNMFMFVDDYRPVTSDPNEVVVHSKVIATLVRAGIEGGKAFEQKQERTPNGGWTTRINKGTHPFFIAAGEGLPPQIETSTTQRMLAVEVDKATSFDLKGKALMEVMHKRRAFTPSVAGFLQWRAKIIQDDYKGDLRAAREALYEHTKTRAEKVLKGQGLPVGRVTQVARTYLMGVCVYLEFAVDVGALSQQKADALEQEWARLIIKLVQLHYKLHLEEEDYSSVLLSAIKGALLQGGRNELVIGPAQEAGQQSIGTVGKVKGVGWCIQLIPEAVKEITKQSGIPGHAIDFAMKPLVVLGSNGEIKRVSWIRGINQRLYCMRPDVMSADEFDHFITGIQGNKK
jgi:hypothetical protein